MDVRRLPDVVGEGLRQIENSRPDVHDLRGSALMRLALADATVPQIATFTGHSLKGVEPILDAHYLGRDVKLAEIAVMKLETRTNL